MLWVVAKKSSTRNAYTQQVGLRLSHSVLIDAGRLAKNHRVPRASVLCLAIETGLRVLGRSSDPIKARHRGLLPRGKALVERTTSTWTTRPPEAAQPEDEDELLEDATEPSELLDDEDKD